MSEYNKDFELFDIDEDWSSKGDKVRAKIYKSRHPYLKEGREVSRDGIHYEVDGIGSYWREGGRKVAYLYLIPIDQSDEESENGKGEKSEESLCLECGGNGEGAGRCESCGRRLETQRVIEIDDESSGEDPGKAVAESRKDTGEEEYKELLGSIRDNCEELEYEDRPDWIDEQDYERETVIEYTHTPGGAFSSADTRKIDKIAGPAGQVGWIVGARTYLGDIE